MNFAAIRRFDPGKTADFLWLCYPAAILTSLSAGQGLAVLLALLWFLTPSARRNRAWPAGLAAPAAAFFAWVIVTTALASPGAGDIKDIVGKWPYMLLLPLAFAQAASGQRIWRALLIVIVVVLAQYPYFLWSYFFTDYARARAASGGSPNLGSNLMMVVLAVLPALVFLKVRGHAVLWGAVTLLILALVLTLNRAALLGCAVGLTWICRRRFHPALAAILSVLVLMVLLFPETRIARRAKSLVNYPASNSFQERLLSWGSGMRMVRDRPLAGFVSKRRFKEAYWSTYRNPVAGEKFSPGHVHNSVIQTGIFHGIPGLGLLLWWLTALWRQVRKLRLLRPDPDDPRRASLAWAAAPLFLAAMVNAQFDFVIAEGQRAMLFYVLTGLILGCALNRSKRFRNVTSPD